jgi:hypothetical protein
MISFIYKETCCEISDGYDYDGYYFRIIFSWLFMNIYVLIFK